MKYKTEWKRRAIVLLGQGLTPQEVAVNEQITSLIGHWGIDVRKKKIWILAKEIRNSQTEDKPAQPVKSFASTATFDEIKREVAPHLYNPFNLPLPDHDVVERFKLPIGCNNVLLLSDIHVPYHDIPALTTALKYGKEQGINTIYLNGDSIDFHGLSDFEKDPLLRSPDQERDMLCNLLSVMREIFPNAQIYFKEGNHEKRWLRYIRNKAPLLEKFREFSLPCIFDFNKYGVHHIENTTIVEMGKLIVLHGHELYGSGGVMPARSLWMKVKCSAIMGHVHVPSEFSDKNIKDEFSTCWSTGCLSHLRPKYNPNSRYVHGFAHVTTDDNGNFNVRNFRIVNGKIC